MNTNLQANGHTSGQEEIQEKPQTSQGLVLTGDKAEEFRKMALEVVEGNNEVIKMLDDLEEEKEKKRLKKEQEEKPTLEEICQLLRDSGNAGLKKSADLIEKTGNIDEKDDGGDTALHNSSGIGLTNIVDKLLKAGVDIEARNNNGWTPLIYASINGKTETVKLLLDRGANIEVRDNTDGWTPLIYASFYGEIETVKLLLDRGAKVNERDNDGETALKLTNNKETRDLLISYGAIVYYFK